MQILLWIQCRFAPGSVTEPSLTGNFFIIKSSIILSFMLKDIFKNISCHYIYGHGAHLMDQMFCRNQSCNLEFKICQVCKSQAIWLPTFNCYIKAYQRYRMFFADIVKETPAFIYNNCQYRAGSIPPQINKDS